MSALIHSMHHKGKIGIAKMCKGKTGQPQMVALLPQLLELEEAPAEVTSSSSSEGESRRVKLPCGLHLIPLPFAEDIRSISKPPPLEEDAFTPQQLECARGLVSALRLPPERNPIGGCINPATAVHYNTLEQLALNVPGSEQPSIIDGTKPDLKWLEQSQPQLDAFKDAFELHDVDVDGGASKRQKTGPKVEKLATPTSLAEWIAAHLQGRISTLTNPALKDFCKSRGLPVGGKKDDLLARIADHLEEEMARDPSLAGGGGGGGETSAAAAAAPKPDDDF